MSTSPSPDLVAVSNLLAVLSDPVATEAKLAEMRAETEALNSARKGIADEQAALAIAKAEVQAAREENRKRAESIDELTRKLEQREAAVKTDGERNREIGDKLDLRSDALAARESVVATREKAAEDLEADVAASNDHSRRLLREVMDLEERLSAMKTTLDEGLAGTKTAIASARSRIGKPK